MGIRERIMVLLRKSTSAALAPAPDPRVTHLTSHQKQRALLNQVAKAGKEVSAAKHPLHAPAEAVRAKLPAMEEQARQELNAGRDSTARPALQRRPALLHHLQPLEPR